ncbi:MAG TPA: GtrA family protein [Acidimicrobiales bacterium]|nr:GtrA family protein [Acidimicrobiales bacterium]
MSLSISSLRERARSDTGQKAIRYTLVSVVAVIVSQVALAVFYGVLHWGPVSSAVTSAVFGGVPSYYLNRRWAWGKTGKSHLWREVVPFWSLAFIGLAFSTWTVAVADNYAQEHFTSHLAKTALVNGASLFGYGVLWIGKFILFNKVIFAHHPEELEADPALDGRTGIPT